jgi:Flp pilus assembly protein TadG
MEKNKMLVWGGVIVVIIIAVALFFVFKNNQTTSQTGDQANNQTQTEPQSAQDISSQDTGAAAAPISYANALIKYADRRIQLDKNCQATPHTVTYKDNTGIMIDNRSAQTRTVKVGTTFTIKPYGFKIVVLPDVYLKSKTILVDCDQSQNVATVVVQE